MLDATTNDNVTLIPGANGEATKPGPINEVHRPARFLDVERDDESTYLSQHPMWEPYIDGAVLADNSQDLEATIGKCTVRQRVMDHTDTALVTARDGKACAVVGTWFTPPSIVSALTNMDQVAEPFGSRTVLGKASTYFGTLRHPVITISIKLPDSLGAMLAVDGVQRTVWVTRRGALDGTKKVEFYTTVYNNATRASVLLRGVGVALVHKNTKSVALIPSRVAAFAESLPARVAEHAAGLAAMMARSLTRSEVEALALQIASKGKIKPAAETPDTDGDDDGEAEAKPAEIKRSVKQAADTIVNMILAADGTRVPKSTEPGAFNALQVFEAACAFDRYHRKVKKTGITDRDAVVRLSRVLDGDTYGDRAWTILVG